MKNSNNNTIALVLLAIVVLALISYMLNARSKTNLPASAPTATSTSVSGTSVVYKDSNYGFTFDLPESWKGYSVIKSTWEGTPISTAGTKQSGTKLIIRNPKWTAAKPYEDIPVMVFTLAQWQLYSAESFSVSAAPILASELGRNNVYVFALPPRWNFDSSEGYQEAESIVNSKPLNTFNVGTSVSGKLNINVVCEGALSYMTFPDSVSADKFVAECKEGKRPEVIEKYKAGLNIQNGAAI